MELCLTLALRFCRPSCLLLLFCLISGEVEAVGPDATVEGAAEFSRSKLPGREYTVSPSSGLGLSWG